MDYKKIQTILGNLAHEAVEKEFKAVRQTHFLIVDRKIIVPAGRSLNIGTSWKVNPFDSKKFDPYIGWIRICLQTKKDATFPLEPSKPGYSRRPDLADINTHDIYEVKPKARHKAGLRQLKAFKQLLEQADREYLFFRSKTTSGQGEFFETLNNPLWKGGKWVPKLSCALTIGGIGKIPITFSNEGDGIILWEINRRELIKDPVYVTTAEKLKKYIPLLNNQKQAERQGAYIKTKKTEIASLLPEVSTENQIAAAALMLTAAILLMTPIPGDEAIVFSFAMGLLK